MNKTIINLAHANGFPAGSYKTMLGYLPEHYQVIAKPQFAHDSRFPIHQNWRYLVDELIEFIEQHQQKVVGLGHSFGGVITFLAACKRPDLFHLIILLDPPIFVGATAFALKLAKHTPLIDKITPAGMAKVRRNHWPENTDLTKIYAKSRLFRNFDPRCLQDYVNSATQAQHGKLSLTFDPNVEADIFRHIPTNIDQFKGQLTVPGYFIYGEKTDVAKPKFVNKFCAQQPKLTKIAFADGGHMFPLEYPERSAALIQQIIDKHLQ